MCWEILLRRLDRLHRAPRHEKKKAKQKGSSPLLSDGTISLCGRFPPHDQCFCLVLIVVAVVESIPGIKIRAYAARCNVCTYVHEHRPRYVVCADSAASRYDYKNSIINCQIYIYIYYIVCLLDLLIDFGQVDFFSCCVFSAYYGCCVRRSPTLQDIPPYFAKPGLRLQGSIITIVFA